jgi:formamidopyrimidine-DNA glycosylase
VPEGPEVETVRRSLAPLLVGAELGRARVSKHALRTRVTERGFSHVDGRRVVAVERHGKALFIALDDESGLEVRLGMTGKLLVVDARADVEGHTHVRIDVQGARELRYIDARRFGEVVPYANAAARAAIVAEMGPDAITLDDAGRASIAGAMTSTKRALKDVLLDQKVLAGVGNIYAAEILWRARLSPFRAARTLRKDEVDALLDATASVMADAVKHRGTSFSDYVDANGAPGDNFAHLAVFQRGGEPCPRCRGLVKRAVQGARSTFFCPTCQRARRLR